MKRLFRLLFALLTLLPVAGPLLHT